MKRGFFAALLAGLLMFSAVLFPSVTYAETTAPTRTLSVTGQGLLEVKPDTATITLGITQLKPTPAEAYAAMSQDLINIAGSVKSMGIKEEQIETSLFNLQAEYNWTEEAGQVLKGYRATTSLSITTQELDKVAALIQQAVSSGANQLSGIRFYVKDTDKLMEQALDMAVDDAKAKADRVAGRLGAKVVSVKNISIYDNGVSMYSQPMYDSGRGAAMVKADAAPAPVYGGTATFTARVSVTFEIQ